MKILIIIIMKILIIINNNGNHCNQPFNHISAISWIIFFIHSTARRQIHLVMTINENIQHNSTKSNAK